MQQQSRGIAILAYAACPPPSTVYIGNEECNYNSSKKKGCLSKPQDLNPEP